jgi:uncharacterized protein
MNNHFTQAIENRRSIYALSKGSPISNKDITNLVEHSVKYVPSAFNSQSARVVILFAEHHDRLWDITRETLRKIVPEANFASTNEKMDSFKNGYGTVLFFEDQSVIEGLQNQFALYKENFPIWSLESSGMLQFVIWTALEDAGLGASLQHYNPLIDDAVKAEWNLPGEWKLLAQMPFGNPMADPGDKEYPSMENSLKVFG